MKFKIKVDYRTGDSFNTYDESKCLEGEWEDIKIIEENVKRLTAHYKWYQEINDYSWKKPKSNIKVPDCVILYGNWDTTGSIKLLTDKSVEYIVSPFWCGYFEHLYSISIETSSKVKFY